MTGQIEAPLLTLSLSEFTSQHIVYPEFLESE
jgi:hypothetical protein